MPALLPSTCALRLPFLHRSLKLTHSSLRYQAGLGRRVEFDERGNAIDPPNPNPNPNPRTPPSSPHSRLPLFIFSFIEPQRNANANPNDINENNNNDLVARTNGAVDPQVAYETALRARALAVAALPFWAREERGPVLSQIAAFFVPLVLSVNPHWHLPDLSARNAPLPPPPPPPLVA